jgi:replication-associated recombination protein RarA
MYQLQLIGGYDFGEVASALQKSVRRGLEGDALFWATELDISGYGEYVWKRLRIITSEDVGLAETNMPAVIGALYDNWKELRKKKDVKHGPERLFLVHAVLLLCRARKSRIVDNALIIYYEAKRESKEIPDYARDKHTLAGKRLGRGWTHFFEEGTRLENPVDLDDPYLKQAREVRTDGLRRDLTKEQGKLF